MYEIDGKQYENPVLVFATQDQAEKANRQISYTKGLDMKATHRWDKPRQVDGLFCITHPVVEGVDFLNEVIEFVDDVLLVADLMTEVNGEVEVKTLGETAVAASMILQAKATCTARIHAGFDSDCLSYDEKGEKVHDVVKHFDCEDHDQNSIAGLAITALLGLQGGTTEETHWKGSGELECYDFKYAQILRLAVDMKKHVQSNVDQFNTERKAILGVS